MNFGFRFREWNIYKDARIFRVEMMKILRAFPKDELYALIDQTKRALLSIVLNIAESANKNTDKDMRVYINRSHCSLDEVVACFDSALDSTYITNEQHDQILQKASGLAKQLNGFSNHLSKVNSQQSKVDTSKLTVNSQKLKVSKGFTLIELLLVVGILAVVFGLALPFALNTKFTNELDTAAENLRTTLREAQSQSVAAEGDTPYGVYFDTVAAPPKYTIYKGTSWNDKDESFNAGGYGTTELPKSSSISFAPVAWISQDITFERLTGELFPNITSDKTITISIPDIGSKEITVTVNGLIY